MSISISLADEKDIDDIKAINEASMPENYAIETYQKLYPTTYIAKINETIVGYVMMARLATETKSLAPYSITYKNQLVHWKLFSIAVHPDHRKKGVAKRLMKQALKEYKKQHVLLSCRVSNDVAKHIYDQFNFTLVEQVKDMYENPKEDGIILVRKKC